jgi:hypothetical protein
LKYARASLPLQQRPCEIDLLAQLYFPGIIPRREKRARREALTYHRGFFKLVRAPEKLVPRGTARYALRDISELVSNASPFHFNFVMHHLISSHVCLLVTARRSRLISGNAHPSFFACTFTAVVVRRRTTAARASETPCRTIRGDGKDRQPSSFCW